MSKIKVIALATIATFVTETACPLMRAANQFDASILNESGEAVSLDVEGKRTTLENGTWKHIRDANVATVIQYAYAKSLRTRISTFKNIDMHTIGNELDTLKRQREEELEEYPESEPEEYTDVLITIYQDRFFSYEHLRFISGLKHQYKILKKGNIKEFFQKYNALRESVDTASQKYKRAQQELEHLTRQVEGTSFEELFKDRMQKIKTFSETAKKILSPILETQKQLDPKRLKYSLPSLREQSSLIKQIKDQKETFTKITKPLNLAFAEVRYKISKEFDSQVGDPITAQVKKIKEDSKIIAYLEKELASKVKKFKEKYAYNPAVRDSIEWDSKALYKDLIKPILEEIKKSFKTEVEEKIKRVFNDIIGDVNLLPQVKYENLRKLVIEEYPSMTKSFKKLYAKKYASSKIVLENIDQMSVRQGIVLGLAVAEQLRQLEPLVEIELRVESLFSSRVKAEINRDFDDIVGKVKLPALKKKQLIKLLVTKSLPAHVVRFKRWYARTHQGDTVGLQIIDVISSNYSAQIKKRSHVGFVSRRSGEKFYDVMIITE